MDGLGRSIALVAEVHSHPVRGASPIDIAEQLGDEVDLIRALAWHAVLRTGAHDLGTGGRAEGPSPLVYVDKNPWGRATDNLAIQRNVAEAAAMRRLTEKFRSGVVRLAYSTATFSEGSPSDGSESASRIALREVLGLGLRDLPLVFHDRRRDTNVVENYLCRERGISGYDSIHSAASLLEGVWYFVTGDDQLRKRLNRLYVDWGLPVRAGTPIQALQFLGQGAPVT